VARRATADSLHNALADDLAYSLDPAAWARGIGWTLDPWQTGVLKSTHPRLLLNCCRQSGKSTVASLLALHTALYRPRSLTLLLSPSQRQSMELFRKVLAGYRYLNRPVPAEAENQMSLALDNGSRVISLPGNESTVRGYSKPSLLIVDEAAQVPDSYYKSLRPMLAVSRGRLLALSTPFGMSGWWAECWHSSTIEHWQKTRITADECPRIEPSFLDEEQQALGDWWFRQEYFCEFMQDEFAVFREEDIAALITKEVAPWRL
jgi:hypothetical protein